GERRRDHLVARPDAEGDEREVERGGAGRDGEHVLRLQVKAHARLELGGARPGRQPARPQRVGDGLDLLLADRRRLEREESVAPGRLHARSLATCSVSACCSAGSRSWQALWRWPPRRLGPSRTWPAVYAPTSGARERPCVRRGAALRAA